MMSAFCRLLSTIEGIPNQNVSIGSSVTIGRNRECRIRDIKCSRSYCEVSLNDENNIVVKYNKTGSTQSLSNGDFVTGPGFQYKVVIIHHAHQSNELSHNQSNGQLNNHSNGLLNNHSNGIVTTKQETDDDVFSYQDLLNPLIHNPISAQTVWQVSCLGRVHICKFLGGGQTSRFIAAFDFDGTLVAPKSGNKYPIDADDWKLLDKSLPQKIEKYVKNGYRFVVVSNQLGLSQGRMKLEEIKHRFEAALGAIGCPCLVLIAAFDDIYRKPRPGLWQLLSNESNDVSIDTTSSFYVGDAAGRKKQLNGKSDHSAVDLLFAANNGLPFLTPERFLSDIKPKAWDSSKKTYSGFNISTFHPFRSDKNFIATKIGCNLEFKDISELLSSYSGKLHSIIFCGLPASGKSSFYLNYLERLGYSYVSRDQLKTMDKCQKKIEKVLGRKQNCVIDNINVDLASRSKWIALSKRYSAIPILFYFETIVEQALHNNAFRRIIGVNSPVTDLVIRSQNKNLVKPMINEGFESIYKINFVPKFSNKDHESLYYMYLSER